MSNHYYRQISKTPVVADEHIETRTNITDTLAIPHIKLVRELAYDTT